MRRFVLLGAIVACFGLSFGVAFATVIVSDPTLMQVQPAAPAPYSQAEVGLPGLGNVAPGATIRWFVDDIEMTNHTNRLAITVPVAGAGEAVSVRAQIVGADQSTLEAIATIIPARVDLLIGANSHVPHFYRGRALPAGSSQISARALVFGAGPGPFQYQWRLGGQPQFNTVSNSNLFTFGLDFAVDELVEVTVLNQAGQVIAEKQHTVEVVEPEIYFYESNPLQGLLPNALKSPFYFLHDEITLRGEPYYFGGNTGTYDIDWKVDGQPVAGDQNPLELSLVKTEEAGTAAVSLNIINTDGFSESAESGLTITY